LRRQEQNSRLLRRSGKAKVTLVAEVHDAVGRYRTVPRTVRVTI